MKISVADELGESSMKALQSFGQVQSGVAKDAEVLIVRSKTKVTKELVDSMPKLKLVVRAGVGLDNVDCEYCTKKGLTVKNTPNASTISVAELVFAHMLSLSRKIATSTRLMKEGKWPKGELKGVELFGKTLGILGYGRIGKEVGKRAKAFGMNVIAHDPFLKEADVPLLTLDEVLVKSDIVTLHLPLTNETRNIVSKERIAKMKDGAVIINASRGGTADEDAILKALQSGKLRGAGLDVFANEPYEGGPLTAMDNVTLTPHIGAETAEAQKRIGEEVIAIVKEFSGGKK